MVTTNVNFESADNVIPFSNGRQVPSVLEAGAADLLHSTLERLPGYSTILDVETTGEELGRLFSTQTDLPGVILFEGEQFIGVISQAHFYKCVSRAFGREIYYRRSADIMLTGVEVKPLQLLAECSIQSAVEQCLARPADYVYEPFLVYHGKSNQYRLCAFQALLLASSQLSALRSQQMEQILNSVTDGLLVIDRNFRIGSEYSKVVGKLFERTDLHEVSLPEVLHPLLDSVTYEQLQDYLRILFDPKLIDRLIKSINPAKQISARFTVAESPQQKRTKHFSLNFERIRTQAEISQVLVRIEDITQRINLAKELEQQEIAAEEKLQLVMQILQVEPVALRRFMADFEEHLVAKDPLLAIGSAGPESSEAIRALFRKVHTLKGEASLLQLPIHERVLHQFEDQLDKLRALPAPGVTDLIVLKPALEAVQKLGEQTQQALDQLKVLDTSARAPSGKEDKIEKATEAGLVETLSGLIEQLSEKLNKPAQFHAILKEEQLPEPYKKVLRDVLIHLARNSMVHGIEPVDIRLARGKNPAGLIQLEMKTHPEYDEIIFQDDGGGLDFDKIRQRAGELGWKLMSEDELRYAIFEPGFSTADKVTDLAGRGVGLDAIRHALQSVSGRIIPHSEKGAYCAFQILLPKNSRANNV